MLAQTKMVGFIMTTDYERARSFYEEKLGFEFVSRDPFALVMRTRENALRIVHIPGFEPAAHTVLGWEVSSIEEVVAWLSERGVVFDDHPFLQDHLNRIWTTPDGNKVAWFKDPDGNVLSVSQRG